MRPEICTQTNQINIISVSPILSPKSPNRTHPHIIIFDAKAAKTRSWPSPSKHLHETDVGERLLTVDTAEAIRMPTVAERLDDTTDDKLATAAAARRVQRLEVILAVFAAFELQDNVHRDIESANV